ncbi:hypothetical protein HZH68_005050 [Vespula germanica]|uniref:Uncharacterized protein n=1 Tax=Vespula germanica TaxID=30212 RepID=A0A834KF81_VESGE|nr:hypothetical protein HZH68_005050 [Vespula germanica]
MTFDSVRGESCYTGDCERMHDTFVARNPTSSLHLSIALDDDDDDDDDNDNDDNNDDDNEDDNDEILTKDYINETYLNYPIELSIGAKPDLRRTLRRDKDAGSTRCTFKSMEEKEKDDEDSSSSSNNNNDDYDDDDDDDDNSGDDLSKTRI